MADITPQLERLIDAAVRLFESTSAEAILLLVDEQLDWARLRQLASSGPVLVAADDEAHLDGAADHGLRQVTLDVAGLPVHERLAQALLECVAAEIISSDAQVVAVY
ncbi:MAG: DNA integrity scanning protein DisA nucleotide-binding domain protein, partial [Pirellulales bacterium]